MDTPRVAWFTSALASASPMGVGPPCWTHSLLPAERAPESRLREEHGASLVLLSLSDCDIERVRIAVAGGEAQRLGEVSP